MYYIYLFCRFVDISRVLLTHFVNVCLFVMGASKTAQIHHIREQYQNQSPIPPIAHILEQIVRLCHFKVAPLWLAGNQNVQKSAVKPNRK